jgi:hypothetical protein
MIASIEIVTAVTASESFWFHAAGKSPIMGGMSEESPPPLRLKPRLRPEGGETPAANPPATPPVEAGPAATAGTDAGAGRLRLKPKLASEPEPQPPAEAAPVEPVPESPAAPEKPRLKPRLSAEPETAAKAEETVAPPAEPAAVAPSAEAPLPPPADVPAAEEAPKFKLKPKTAGAAGQPPVAAPPPVAPPAAGMPPPLAAAEAPAVAPPPPAKRPPPPAAALKKKLMVLGGIAAVLLVGGGLYFGWEMYGPKPAAGVPVAPGAPAARPAGVTPSETLNQIAAAPGAMIGKAQDAIAARRDREQERIDAAATGEDVPERRFLDTPLPGQLGEKPAEPAVKPVSTESQIAPGVRATTWASSSQITSTAQASQEFRNYVAGLTISGIFWGTPTRALINGRTYRAGDTIDQAQGIVLLEADNAAKLLIFQDRTGATVSRK